MLIVDEVTTSGDTLRLALAAVREVGPAQVRTATSFVRLNAAVVDARTGFVVWFGEADGTPAAADDRALIASAAQALAVRLVIPD